MPQNFLSPIGFKFSLQRAPTLEYFTQRAPIPSVSAGFAPVPTPFSTIPLAPDKLEYGDFSLSFRVDENLANYVEILDWLVNITYPDNFAQYNTLQPLQEGLSATVMSDATLTILNSNHNPNVQVLFEDTFPIGLTEVPMDVTQTDIQYVEATATFKYRKFSIQTL